MPNCSVVGCDYKKWPKDGTYQSFPIPTEPNLRSKWLNKLNRDKTFNPDAKNVAVCIRHFESDAFVSAEDNKTTRGKEKKRNEGYKWQAYVADIVVYRATTMEMVGRVLVVPIGDRSIVECGGSGSYGCSCLASCISRHKIVRRQPHDHYKIAPADRLVH